MVNNEQLGTLGRDFYESLEDKLVYIDSNIFMDERFSIILKDFLQYKLNILIPKEQYDELYNLKKQDSKKGKLARDAFKLIENLLDIGILKIDGLDENSVNRNAYGDNEFINIFKQNIENNINSVFFTNDADLRIRIKSLQKKVSTIFIYGNKELKELSELEEKKIEEELRKKREEERAEEDERKRQEEANKTTFDKVVNGAKTVASVAVGAAAVVASIYYIFNE
jgi:rRNA-processing protein FCF1